MASQETVELEERIGALLDRSDLQGAATEAVKGYGPQILGYLVAVLRDESAAYDVFSQFSEDLWRGIGTFRRQCSVRTWAYKLAWHATQRHRRDAFRRHARGFLSGEMSKIAEEVRASTAIYLRTAVKDRVARLRERLEPQEQTLLILRVDKGLSWTEVAEVMSEEGEAMDGAALRKRFERLKVKLRNLAEEEGLLEK
jgi:RNA polymerase sigma-70 factor (ECF subfamily)